MTDIQFVFTVALKKEIPEAWLESHHIPVYTLASLKSGVLNGRRDSKRGIIIIITGLGPAASKEAARWIKDNLAPLFVVNVGTCGLISKNFPLGSWIIADSVSDEMGGQMDMDARIPFPKPKNIIKVHSLMSVEKPVLDGLPESLQNFDAVDMECYSQARVFKDTQTSFFCLKFSTDYSDSNALIDFDRYLPVFQEEFKKLLNFMISSTPSLIKGDTTRFQKAKDNVKTGISVIIPVYSRENTVGNAIDSVLSQTYLPDQIIIVDDGSTDNTRRILESYDKKVSCIFLSKNSGPSRARNEGVRHARNEWIAFLDSDDRWEKNKLKNQLEYLHKYPFYQIIQSEEKWIRNGVRVNPCKHHKKPVGWIWKPSLERCLISPSGVLLKKSLIEAFGGFEESLPVCEDYDLWLKISRYFPVGLEPSFSVIKYGGHADQLSRKYPVMDKFRVQSLLILLENESHPEFKRQIVRVLSKKLQILAKGYEKRRKKKKAKECRELLKTITNPATTQSCEVPVKRAGRQ